MMAVMMMVPGSCVSLRREPRHTLRGHRHDCLSYRRAGGEEDGDLGLTEPLLPEEGVLSGRAELFGDVMALSSSARTNPQTHEPTNPQLRSSHAYTRSPQVQITYKSHINHV